MTQPLKDQLDFKTKTYKRKELYGAHLDLKNYCGGWVGGN